MPRKMDTSRLLNGRLGVRKSRKSVNIHTKSGVIWGIPGKANLSMGVAADRDSVVRSWFQYRQDRCKET